MSLSSNPADENHARSDAYRAAGLTTWFAEDRIWLWAGNSANAITVLDEIGTEAHRHLQQVCLYAPTVAHDSGLWTFLTSPVEIDSDTQEFMARRSILIAKPGVEVLLPSPADEHAAHLWWIREPLGELPSTNYVLETLSICHKIRSRRVGVIRQ
ncbi:hypothetical protein [Nocardia crassostreae]|uniref:hypothetical protein n=1 Tax=Nocardia crassostreae TaxID=53428 RepID=UPI000834A424|nr:hypothetical protein [Nocardia crassostreae]